jgi:hypothetical protein
MLGKKLYWQSNSITCDTLAWAAFLKKTFDTTQITLKNPEPSLEFCCVKGMRLYELKGGSAIVGALLYDLGYKIVMLTQWNALPHGKILVGAAGMPREYKDQRIMSDFYWEDVERVEVKKPGKIEDDFSVMLYFSDAGMSVFKGKTELNVACEQVVGTTDGLVLQLNNGTANQDLVIKRRVFRTCVLVPADKNAKAVIAQLEKAMDKLKLDLSYQIPKLTDIKPRN